MADKRNERTEYNWSYSGDDARIDRSRYTRGFDPDYLKHAAERSEEQEQTSQRRRESAVRSGQRQRPSARRARLSAEQEVRTGTRTQEERESVPETSLPDRVESEPARMRRTERGSTGIGRTRAKSARTQRSDTGQGKTARTQRTDIGQGKAARTQRSDIGQGKTMRTRRAAQDADYAEETAQSVRRAGRAASGRAERSTSGRNRRGTGRKKSTAYRRQMLRRRYTLIGIAAAAGLFVLLLLTNTYTLTITLSGDDPLYLELGDTWQDPGATAVYKGSLLHFGDTEVPVVSEQEINNRACGTYEVTYHAQHKDQEVTATRMVIIPDRTAPVITLDETVNVVRKGDEWQDSFTAIDDQDGDITANVEILGEVNMRRDGKYQLTYRVQDSAGNEAEASRTVIVSSVAINRPEMARQGDNNVIYLTFDDGPGMYTERLLEILDNHNVKATFFVTDTNPASRDLIGEEYRRGHTIGVHSATHNYDLIYESGAAFWEDLDQEMAVIKEQTGSETPFMRFPGGSSNDLIMMNDELRRELAAGVRSRGLKYYDWTIDSYDSNDEYTSDDVYWAMVDQTSVAEPKMVLCHDLKRTSVDAIDNYLTWAIENHYVFLPITEETPEVHHEDL